MKNAEKIYLSSLIIVIVTVGMSTFYGGILTSAGLDSTGLDNITQSITQSGNQTIADTNELNNETLGVKASESSLIPRSESFIGGIFEVARLPLTAFQSLGNSLDTFGRVLKLEGIGYIITIIGSMVAIVLLIDFIRFVRGVSG